MTVMLYKHPGKHKLHGNMFDYIIVEADEVQQKVKEGWCTTTTNALKASIPKKHETDENKNTIKLSYDDFSEEQKEEIRSDKGTLTQLSKKYSTTMYTIRKIRDYEK